MKDKKGEKITNNIFKIKKWLFATKDGKNLHIFLLTLYIPFMTLIINYGVSLITAIVLSLGKEFYDKYYKKRKISIQDLIYDVKGIFYGSILTTLIYKLIIL